MLTFAYIWLLALLPLPWLLRAFLPQRRIPEVAVRVPFGSRLRGIHSEGGSVSRAAKKTSRHILPMIIWALLLLALARPQWLEPAITKEQPSRDLLLLVDLSGSMQQEDFTNTEGNKVDRLTAVKEVLGDFLERREGDRVGLVVFGDAPFLQAPFSTDLNLVRQLLDQTGIGMAGPSTAFGDAIGLGISLFDQSEAPAKTIIALTDGNDTKSQVPPVEAARIAGQRDIRIHTVAIGDPTTVGEEKLDEAVLRDVSAKGQGSYFFANDRQRLMGIYEELDKIETRQVTVITHRPRLDLYFWPLLVGLLLSLAEKTWGVFRSSQTSAPVKNSARVRVHPLTGKLEMEA